MIILITASLSSKMYNKDSIREEFTFCNCGRRHNTGAKCAVHKDENYFLFDAQDVCVKREMSQSCLLYQWCDVLCNYITQVQHTRLLASRGCVRFARRPSLHWEKFQKKSTHAHMCWSFDSTNPSYPYPEIFFLIRPFARWTRLAQLSTHTKHRSQSVESFTSQRFCPDIARIHISLD